MAFPTIGAKARVEQARTERDVLFGNEMPGSGQRNNSQGRNKYRHNEHLSDNDITGHRNGGVVSYNGSDDLHDPDMMQWGKFSKGSGNVNSFLGGTNKGMNGAGSSQLSSNGGGGGDASGSSMRRTVRNDMKIDGVHDRRNKYLNNGAGGPGSNVAIGVGGGNHSVSSTTDDINSVNMDR